MLAAFEVAIELVGELRPIVEQMRPYDANLADEIRQAALRAVMYLAQVERAGGSQRHALRLAHGEVTEITQGLERAQRWGYVHDCVRAQRRLDRLSSLCWAGHARAA